MRSLPATSTALLTAAATVLLINPIAAFPPPRQDITWVQSQHHPNVSISYKNPQICETTPGVKSYSGYVHLPPHTLNQSTPQDYPINTFFWFVEARNGNPHRAPLSIWLNGGPGGSSLMGMLAENGPCWINADGNSTRNNEFAWNREVNMLFIDQPVQVGYSYDGLFNGTYNVLADPNDPDQGPVTVQEFGEELPETNATFWLGTFASQNATRAPNSTQSAAVAFWYFAQTWFEEFPAYKPHDEKISLWAESYGGHYGPTFMEFFQQQNDKITRGEISGPGTHYLHLDTLGLVNACIDTVIQGPAYSDFAWNNTYGLQAINASMRAHQLRELPGVMEQARVCRALSASHDPAATEVCRNVSEAGAALLTQPYQSTGKHGWYDVTHGGDDPFPPSHHVAFLNQQWVQGALGVPVNFTAASWTVGVSFYEEGDMWRDEGNLPALGRLLDNGVKVHLVYGDRDFACNWIGGERASLAIPHRYQKEFGSAGYTPLVLDDAGPPFVPYGLTRQMGNLSFSRVFQAGHMAPSYQPELSVAVFERTLFNRDVATGTVDLTATGGWAGAGEGEAVFRTEGPTDTWWRKNEVMQQPEHQCYTWALGTCSQEEIWALGNGTAVVKDWFVVGIDEDMMLTEEKQKQQQQQQQTVLELGVDEL